MSSAPQDRAAAGENLAALYSLIATCEVNGVNPVAYMADVLMPCRAILLRESTS